MSTHTVSSSDSISAVTHTERLEKAANRLNHVQLVEYVIVFIFHCLSIQTWTFEDNCLLVQASPLSSVCLLVPELSAQTKASKMLVCLFVLFSDFILNCWCGFPEALWQISGKSFRFGSRLHFALHNLLTGCTFSCTQSFDMNITTLHANYYFELRPMCCVQ